MLKVGNYETSSRAYVGRFNFRGQEQQKKIGLLSGGERNRVHLAKMLRSGGNLLLLDEPTNDLDVETLRALEQALLEFPGSAMVISHDRWFLDRIATHILAFEGDSKVDVLHGQLRRLRRRPQTPPGSEARQPAPHQVQAPGGLMQTLLFITTALTLIRVVVRVRDVRHLRRRKVVRGERVVRGWRCLRLGRRHGRIVLLTSIYGYGQLTDEDRRRQNRVHAQ